MSLEPAAAALAGIVVLGEFLTLRCSGWRWPASWSPASAPPAPAAARRAGPRLTLVRGLRRSTDELVMMAVV